MKSLVTFVLMLVSMGALDLTGDLLLRVVFKALTSILFVLTGLFAIGERKSGSGYARLILTGLVFGFAGDVLLELANLKGDLLSLMCAICYAIDLLITDKAVSNEKVDAFQLGVFQLGFTGVFMLLLSLLFESPHLPGSGRVWFCTAFLTVFCTGVAFIVQAVAQKYTDPSHVGIIFTLEPVFASVVAYFFAHEVLSPKAYLGAALMLAALLISETGGRKEREGETEPKTTR